MVSPDWYSLLMRHFHCRFVRSWSYCFPYFVTGFFFFGAFSELQKQKHQNNLSNVSSEQQLFFSSSVIDSRPHPPQLGESL